MQAETSDPGVSDPTFAADLARIVDGRWFPSLHHLERVFRVGGYADVVRYCSEALTTTNAQYFSTSWDTYRAALADVKRWAEAKIGIVVAQPELPVVAVGDRIRLTYAPRWTDEQVYEVVVTDVDGADIDVEHPTEGSWTVLEQEQAGGKVRIEVQL